MREKNRERFPFYIPIHYRLYLRLRKIRRQTSARLARTLARRSKKTRAAEDGSWSGLAEVPVSNPPEAINKPAFWLEEDLDHEEVNKVVQGFLAFKDLLKLRGLRYTNTAGSFITRMYWPESERRKLWENAWVLYHAGPQAGDRVLDIGGASTAFSFYLANLGCDVAVVDNDWNNCGTLYNAGYVARKMNWDLRLYDRDVSWPLPFPDNFFERVFSICVIEHLTSPVRRRLMREIARVLKPGGVAALTTDYTRNAETLLADRGLRFGYREKFDQDVIFPSGLRLMGNQQLIDADENGDFLGAFFLQKPVC